MNFVEDYLSGLAQDERNDEVVPFALPMKMDENKMRNIKNTLSRQFNVEAEVLHFDYNQNMLNANYEKALARTRKQTY